MSFRTLPLLSLLCLFSTACNHYNYSPNLVATPFISKKNESTLSVNTGGTLFVSNQDIQGAYNPWKGVTVMANYFQASETFNQFIGEAESHNYRIRSFDGAAGAWAIFPKNNLQIGCFLGGGLGKVKNDFGKQRIATLHYNKTYIQPTFCYTGDIFRIGMATRVSLLAFPKGTIDNSIPENELQVFRRIEQDGPFPMMEAGVNLGLRLSPVTLSASMVYSSPLFRSKHFSSYHFDEVNIGVGLTFDLHYFYKKKLAINPQVPADSNRPN